MLVKRLLEGLNAVVLLIMLVIVVLTVLFRDVLQIPASWSESLADYSFIFLVFIGSAAVMQNEGHIKITTFVDIFGETAKRVFRIVGRILTLPFLVMFVLGALGNVESNWGVSLPTVSWMKISYMYLVLLCSGGIMLAYTVINLYLDIAGRKKPEVVEEGQA